MIGDLPTSLNICGEDWKIRSGFKDCLNIMAALSDDELTPFEKTVVLLDSLFLDFDNMPAEYMDSAVEQAVWFLSCGGRYKSTDDGEPLSNIEKDEQLIFTAISEVVWRDIRETPSVHYWTYVSYLNSIKSTSMFAAIVRIREKKSKHKKLDKEEKKFYEENKEMIDLNNPTDEDEKFIDFINSIT